MAFIAAAAPVLGALGAATSAVGAITGGIASQNASNYQAQIAKNNETVALQNATQAEQAGGASAENQGRKGAARGGALKVGQAASGVDVNKGTAVDVQASEAETNQLDTETVLNNADLKAYGYRTQATGFEAESELDKAKADEAVPAAAISATGGLLSKASSVGAKWGGSGSSGSGSSPVYAPDDI